jgi:hypothetical protein
MHLKLLVARVDVRTNDSGVLGARPEFADILEAKVYVD